MKQDKGNAKKRLKATGGKSTGTDQKTAKKGKVTKITFRFQVLLQTSYCPSALMHKRG